MNEGARSKEQFKTVLPALVELYKSMCAANDRNSVYVGAAITLISGVFTRAGMGRLQRDGEKIKDVVANQIAWSHCLPKMECEPRNRRDVYEALRDDEVNDSGQDR